MPAAEAHCAAATGGSGGLPGCCRPGGPLCQRLQLPGALSESLRAKKAEILPCKSARRAATAGLRQPFPDGRRCLPACLQPIQFTRLCIVHNLHQGVRLPSRSRPSCQRSRRVARLGRPARSLRPSPHLHAPLLSQFSPSWFGARLSLHCPEKKLLWGVIGPCPAARRYRTARQCYKRGWSPTKMTAPPLPEDGWGDLLLDGLPDVGLLDDLQVSLMVRLGGARGSQVGRTPACCT